MINNTYFMKSKAIQKMCELYCLVEKRKGKKKKKKRALANKQLGFLFQQDGGGE
jgi:hypothetical protein